MQYRRDIGKKALWKLISVITFGCRVNQADSLGFEEKLRAAVPSRSLADRRCGDRQHLLGDRRLPDQGARQTIRRIARDNPSRAHCRHRLLRDAAAGRSCRASGCGAGRFRTTTSRVCCLFSTDKPQERRTHAGKNVFLRSLRKLCGCSFSEVATAHAARTIGPGVAGPDRIHAARSDRLCRALLALHHSIDPRPAAKRPGSGSAARSRACRRLRFQGNRADRRPSSGPTAAISVRRVPCIELLERLERLAREALSRARALPHQLARADGLLEGNRRPRCEARRRSRPTSTCRCSTRVTGCCRPCAGLTRSSTTRRSSTTFARALPHASIGSDIIVGSPARRTMTSSSWRRTSKARP